ncbi:cytochrome P450 [Micromonospora rosaria]
MTAAPGPDRITTDGMLADPDLARDGDPETLWARLRAQGPIHRVERDRDWFWAVVTHAEILRVLRDHTRFTSERGMRLDDNPEATATAAGKMLIVSDPPRHGEIRRVVNSAFTPRVVARLERTMRATAARIVDEALRDGGCDLVRVAARLPASVICDMLGVPAEDWDFMVERTTVAFGPTGGRAETLTVAEAHAEILLYFEELLARRRRDPREDLISTLIAARIRDVPLTDEEILLNCDGLLSGGNETTRHATAGGLLALAAAPGQWSRLRRDPALLAPAVQEVLRFTSPATHVVRTAVVPARVGGHLVRPGERVAAWLASGNRDEAVFADAATFDVTRAPNPHLAFASGTHYCLGAALATTELTAMIGEVLRRVERVEPAGPVVRTRSNLVRGYDSVPVTLVPRKDRP